MWRCSFLGDISIGTLPTITKITCTYLQRLCLTPCVVAIPRLADLDPKVQRVSSLQDSQEERQTETPTEGVLCPLALRRKPRLGWLGNQILVYRWLWSWTRSATSVKLEIMLYWINFIEIKSFDETDLFLTVPSFHFKNDEHQYLDIELLQLWQTSLWARHVLISSADRVLSKKEKQMQDSQLLGSAKTE